MMKNFSKNHRGIVCLLLLFLIFFFEVTRGVSTSKKSQNPLIKTSQIDSCLQLLQTGDILLRTGNDMTSDLLRQFNRQNKTYSHCGIVLIENGQQKVYHCIGGEDNPGAGIRTDNVKDFISMAKNNGFGIVRYHLTNTQKKILEKTVRNIYQQQPLFDLNFDLKTDDKLYCAEFVYKAICKATNNNSFIPTSSLKGFRYVSIDNLFLNSHASLICQLRY